jgi:GNAT superfamily N-acetyltransferase
VVGVGEAKLDIHPLTRDRWDDLVTLFDRPGDPKGCWCMFYRVPGRRFQELWGAGARAAFGEVVAEGPPPGLLAYRDGVAVGWCAVAPREAYRRVLNSRVLKPLDDTAGVWSVVCFYVLRSQRRGGVSAALLEAAVAYAAGQGAAVVEGYPRDTDGTRQHANELFVGTRSMFAEAGFSEAGRRSPTRPIMRLALISGRGGPGGPAGSR